MFKNVEKMYAYSDIIIDDSFLSLEWCHEIRFFLFEVRFWYRLFKEIADKIKFLSVFSFLFNKKIKNW